jgi:sterol desaturase/sphingolipid hydroxylase (fatty acid hydroxylase superfamily)
MQAIYEQLLILISTPLYLVIIGLEVLLSNYGRKQVYSWKDTAANVYLMVLNAFVDVSVRTAYLFVLNVFFHYRIFSFSNVIVYWIALVILEDFLYYWLHRFDHEVRLFWAVHITHHSSSRLNFSVGFRSSVFQPLYRFVYFIPLALLGFKPLDIVFIYSITQIWGILVHTELVNKMGLLEYVLVTPSHHRVHHASNPKYLDMNMGMLLIVWDKLFGTFQPELSVKEYQPLKYGLTTSVQKQTPVTILFHEWTSIGRDLRRKDISWRQKLYYVFGPPGWSHDGTRMTSQQLRQLESDNLTVAEITRNNVQA